jgi:flagellar hook-associated protein 2
MSGELGMSTGLMSGIDTDQLVQALTLRQKQPIYSAERKQHELQIQKEEYQSIHSAVSALEDSLMQLSLSATYNRKTIEFGTEGVASGTANNAAEPAEHQLEVIKLAQAHKAASDKQSSSSASLTDQEATISVNGTSLTVNAGITLEELKDGLNSLKSQTNVSASILNNTLILTAADTGSEYEMSLQDVSGNLLESIGVISSPANSVSEIEESDIKGRYKDSVDGTGFTAESGFIAIDDLVIRLNGGEDISGIADAINQEGASGLNAEVVEGKLRIHKDGAEAVIKDVSGNNMLNLGLEVAAAVEYYSNENSTLSINGQDVEISAYATIDDIIDAINTETATTGVTATLDAGQISFAATDGLDIRDSSGTMARDLGFVQDPIIKNELQTAQDAEFKLDGLTITRGSNTFTDVIDGVTIALEDEGTSKLSIGYDTSFAQTTIENFIERYNAAIELVHEKMNFKKDYSIKGFTAEEKEEKSEEEIQEREDAMRQQILSGDPMLQRIYGSLRGMAFMNVNGVENGFSSLFSMGISTGAVGSSREMTQMGKLQISDTEKFADALKNNLGDIRNLFANDSEEASETGIARRIRTTLQGFTSSNGSLTQKAGRPGVSVSSSMLDREIATLGLNILEKNRSLLKYQETLLLQFQGMEDSLAKLQNQSAALAQSSSGGF